MPTMSLIVALVLEKTLKHTDPYSCWTKCAAKIPRQMSAMGDSTSSISRKMRDTRTNSVKISSGVSLTRGFLMAADRHTETTLCE